MKGIIKKKTWVVTFGGFTLYEGTDADEAYEKYLINGPYAKIYNEDE